MTVSTNIWHQRGEGGSDNGWAGAVMLEGRTKPAKPELCKSWSESFKRLELYALWLEKQIPLDREILREELFKKEGMNELPETDYSDLIQKYGEKNVENTCIYIFQATDPRGLAVGIQPSYERVAEVLDTVHREFLTGG